MPTDHALNEPELKRLAAQIKGWAQQLGFQQSGITGIHLDQDEAWLLNWLDKNFHGEMHYMETHGVKRSRPGELVPGTIRVVSVRMDYWPGTAIKAEAVMADPEQAYISRYALGRDYHKVIRNRLKKLASKIAQITGPFGYRAFTDSAPVLEKALAQQAGLGWIGKHTNLINETAGSWFFLGELYTDLPLPIDEPAETHCGTCRACIDCCPTNAIVGANQLDARRCIAYLTIELRGSIPEEFRSLIGNRIYGCDDCQLVCPFNKFMAASTETDFSPRHNLDNLSLVELFGWTEAQFLKNTEGSAIRRIGYECWLRNIAVALGNAPSTPEIITALKKRQGTASEMLQEHIDWALAQHLKTRE